VINLGDEVEDVVTGAEGLVTGRAEYLFKSPELMIQPRTIDSRGIPEDAYWLAESRMQPKQAGGPRSRVHEEETGAAQG
jgi:hypothetical protein